MEVEFYHTLQDSFGSFGMGGGVRGVNEQIVHVNDKPSFRNHVAKRIVHKTLESGGEVSEAEELYCGFKEPFVGDEGGFPLMSVFNSDIIVSPSDIKLGEDFCSLEFVDKVGNEGKRVCVTDSVFVDIAIVLTGLEATIFLFDKEERGRLWGVRGANFACF